MELTRPLIEEHATAYADEEPLYAVEVEQIETLPAAVAAGNYGWRDVEWIVQWYYRRTLGGYPDGHRRDREAAYGENDFEAIRDALAAALSADGPVEAIDSLTTLSGVDVGVASAFLMFIDPESFIVVGDREWAVLVDAGVLANPISEPITTSEYRTFLEACRELADRFDCSMWMLYCAIWRLGAGSAE